MLELQRLVGWKFGVAVNNGCTNHERDELMEWVNEDKMQLDPLRHTL